MFLLPHWARPVVFGSLITVWGLLELSYWLLLGDVSWLEANPPVHLEPQARQTVLTLMFHQRELEGPGAAGWVVPIWRILDPSWSTHRPADRLDLAMRLPARSCLLGPSAARSRLARIFEELARRVWVARHLSEERMVDAWASCTAEQLETCGERVPRSGSVYDAVHLWAHDTGFGPCKERRVTRRTRAAAELLWIKAPDLHRELIEEMQFCPARHAGERSR